MSKTGAAFRVARHNKHRSDFMTKNDILSPVLTQPTSPLLPISALAPIVSVNDLGPNKEPPLH